MKRFYFLALIAVVGISSCIRDDDNIIAPEPIVNEGLVNFDDLTTPLTYADLYQIETYNNGDELWALILSENFIRPGQTQTDAYIYLEFIRPLGGALFADYFIGSPLRPVLFAVYYEDVLLQNGNVADFNLVVEDEELVAGELRLRRFNNDIHDFTFELETFDNFLINGYFTGLLRN